MNLQMQTPYLPPDHKKELEQAVLEMRNLTKTVLDLLTNNNPDSALTALRQFDTRINALATCGDIMNADNEELRLLVARVRKQRDEAIKARNEVMLYLKQRQGK
jgi:hypothetical protein